MNPPNKFWSSNGFVREFPTSSGTLHAWLVWLVWLVLSSGGFRSALGPARNKRGELYPSSRSERDVSFVREWLLNIRLLAGSGQFAPSSNDNRSGGSRFGYPSAIAIFNESPSRLVIAWFEVFWKMVRWWSFDAFPVWYKPLVHLLESPCGHQGHSSEGWGL